MRRISETVSDVLETWEVKISSQSNDKKKKKKKRKKTDPHKESRAKKEEQGKDNESLQDMCKNHQSLQQKKEGICKILSVGYSNYS